MTARGTSETPWYARNMTAHSDPRSEAERSYPEPPRGEWWSDEPEMETYRHLMQQLALIATLRWYWRGRTDFFVGGNLTVYYSPTQRKSVDFRGPDFFVALGVDGTRDRRSWVVWEEGGRYPNLIIELLSDTTEQNDRGEKKDIYEQVFRTPEYFLFDPYGGEGLEGYRIVGGRYVPITPDAHARLASEQLGLLLGVVDGELRLFQSDGTLVAKPEEDAEREHQRAEEASQRAEEATQRAEEATRRVETASRQADEASRRADRAEAELAKLRAELAKRGRDDGSGG